MTVSWCSNSLIINGALEIRKKITELICMNFHHGVICKETTYETFLWFTSKMIPPRELIKSIITEKEVTIHFGFCNQGLNIYGELEHVLDDNKRYEQMNLDDKNFISMFYEIKPYKPTSISKLETIHKKYNFIHFGG